MNIGFLARGCRMLMLAAALVGCSGASWRNVEIDSPYEPPKAVTITVNAPRSAREVAQAFTSALVDELTDHGIKASVEPATSGAPDASLTIVKWDPGSRGLRWLIGFGAGKGEIVVAVESRSVGLEGTADGWVTGGFFGGDSENAAVAAAHMIGQTIATGRKKAEPPRSLGPRSMADRH